MSFSSETKLELCREGMVRGCCVKAEAYGILLYCNTFSDGGIKIMTESGSFSSRLPKLFRKAFGFDFDLAPQKEKGGGKKSLVITAADKLRAVFDLYGGEPESGVAHHVNFAVLEEDCCKASFMRGAFLAGGSITDPQKRYHFELVTDHYNVSREVLSILQEMGFEPKSISRNGNYIIYFKQSEAIADLLTTIGAPVSAMALMNAMVEKEMRNSINRRVNCDTANLEKMVNASMEQVEAINRMLESGEFDKLPEKLKQTASLRLSNPEASMAELALMCDPPVTKSCLGHRLKKIVELSKT